MAADWKILRRGHRWKKALAGNTATDLYLRSNLTNNLSDTATVLAGAPFAEGAAPQDPGLVGAICLSIDLASEVKSGKCIVAVTYGPPRRYSGLGAYRTAYVVSDQTMWSYPLVGLNGVRYENRDYRRARQTRVEPVLLPNGDISSLTAQIEANLGKGYAFGGIPYVFVGYSTEPLNTGQVFCRYRFWTAAPVPAINPGSSFVSLPALGRGEEYIVDLAAVPPTITASNASLDYPWGNPLPGLAG